MRRANIAPSLLLRQLRFRAVPNCSKKALKTGSVGSVGDRPSGTTMLAQLFQEPDAVVACLGICQCGFDSRDRRIMGLSSFPDVFDLLIGPRTSLRCTFVLIWGHLTRRPIIVPKSRNPYVLSVTNGALLLQNRHPADLYSVRDQHLGKASFLCYHLPVATISFDCVTM